MHHIESASPVTTRTWPALLAAVLVVAGAAGLARGLTPLNGDLITAGTPIPINDDVVLAAPPTITLDTTGWGAVPTGADITITGWIEDDPNPTGLTLTSGTIGAIAVGGDIGALWPLTDLALTGGSVCVQAVTTAGAQVYTAPTTLNGNLTTFGGAVTIVGDTLLGSDVAVATAGGDVTFGGLVDGARALTVDAGAGDVDMQDAVGSLSPLASIALTGSRIVLHDVTTTGDQTYTGDVTLSSNVETTGGSVTFEQLLTLDGDGDIMTHGGDAWFRDDVTGPHSLVVNAGSGELRIDGTIDFDDEHFEAGNEAVGCQGSAHVHQTGGVNRVDDKLAVGRQPGSDGRYTISGGQLRAARLVVGETGTGTLHIGPGADVQVSESLRLGDRSMLTAFAGARIHMTGAAFENRSTDEAALLGLGNLELLFEGGPGDVDPLEVAGEIDGGFGHNFALGKLTLGGADRGLVRLADTFDNGNRGTEGVECLFVHELDISATSELDVGNLLLYVEGDVEDELDDWIDDGRLFSSLGPIEAIYVTEDDWTCVIPEPATLSLLAAGLAVSLRRRRRAP